MRKCRWLAILGCFVFSGCGTKFAYNNMDWFVISYIEDFVPLSNNQESELKERLGILQEWHKNSQLPLYISQIETLQNVERSTMKSSFVIVQSEQIKDHIRSIINQFAPNVYALSMQFSPKQDSQFLREFREKQQEYYQERLSLNDETSRQHHREKMQKRLNRWLGYVSKEQEQIILKWSQEWVNTNDSWREYQNNIYQGLSTLVEKKSELYIIQPIMMNMLLNHEVYYPEDLTDKLNQNMEISAKYLVEIAVVSSDKQWSYFLNELESIKSILESLQE